MFKALLLIIFSLGCITGQTVKETSNYSDIGVNETINETVESVVEAPAENTPDNLCANCDDNNPCTVDTCTSGQCVQEKVQCTPSNATCPDGVVATCENNCFEGRCSSCKPACDGRVTAQTPVASPTATPCIPAWQCGEWGMCNNKQNRICTDANSCNTILDKPAEQQDCISLNHIIFSEILYDTPGDELKEEWFKIYNPTDSYIDLTNWTVHDNAGKLTLQGTLQSKSHAIVARNGTAFLNTFGCTPAIGKFTLRLGNDGDYLILKYGNSEIDFVAWEKGYNGSHPSWNITAKEGKSIRRLSMAVDTDSVDDWVAGTAQACDG